MTAEFLDRLSRISVPTLGHFLEDGFLPPVIRRLAGRGTVAGRARTVRIAGQDALAVNRAILGLQPGDFLVVDMSGDHGHAPLGAVTAAAIGAQGAVGVVVDGSVTDLADLKASGLSVHARGTSCLTTKRHGTTGSTSGVELEIAGVRIAYGDLVVADDNGVAVLPPEVLSGVLPLAEASDAAEPDLLARIRSGEALDGLLAT
ncbi:RraA family protein [Arthrobacter cupressi]|uniref:Putative 4-hydroxy-4-methyl-2-oxoglutarate aldolase n=1 Tax=Arthrobacter cupressi TaxID=1045773 RepID=A0A1G8V829_9MICC|nr:RraA family protein [Arthrobacter cupressi]NYD78659.1 regulator of RNase E activity RraA [Arthrobacter cupressi]SDJ62231.1 Regulator of RNase E activity RraA [Arthrobacter cupressi]